MEFDLREVKKTIDDFGGVANYKRSSNAKNAWNVAFTLYNRDNEHKLSAGCMSCARKVYSWLTTKV